MDARNYDYPCTGETRLQPKQDVFAGDCISVALIISVVAGTWCLRSTRLFAASAPSPALTRVEKGGNAGNFLLTDGISGNYTAF